MPWHIVGMVWGWGGKCCGLGNFFSGCESVVAQLGEVMVVVFGAGLLLSRGLCCCKVSPDYVLVRTQLTVNCWWTGTPCATPALAGKDSHHLRGCFQGKGLGPHLHSLSLFGEHVLGSVGLEPCWDCHHQGATLPAINHWGAQGLHRNTSWSLGRVTAAMGSPGAIRVPCFIWL